MISRGFGRKNMKQKLKLCLQLFLTFIKIGAVTFGGGYAMIPIIENEISVKKGWIKDDELLEVTPKNLRLRKSILDHSLRMKTLMRNR